MVSYVVDVVVQVVKVVVGGVEHFDEYFAVCGSGWEVGAVGVESVAGGGQVEGVGTGIGEPSFQ